MNLWSILSSQAASWLSSKRRRYSASWLSMYQAASWAWSSPASTTATTRQISTTSPIPDRPFPPVSESLKSSATWNKTS